MKKNLLFLVPGATLFAFGLTGCTGDDAQKSGNDDTISASKRVEVKITASAAETRTSYQGNGTDNHAIHWSETDAIGVFAFSKNAEDGLTFGRNECFTIADFNPENGSLAGFEGELDDNGIGEATHEVIYHAYYPHDEACVLADGSIEAEIPAVQYPSATSFDGKADFLVATVSQNAPLGTMDSGNSLHFSFKRPIAIVKLNFTNIPSAVDGQKVEHVYFTAAGGKIAGEMDLTFGDGNDIAHTANPGDTATDKVTLDYTEENILFDNEFNAWFTMIPASIQDFSVVIETADYVITKTVSAPDPVEFKSAHVNRAAIDLGKGNVEIKKIPDNTVFIKSGTFMMGSPIDEPNREGNEAQHTVKLTRDFRMSKYQVTRAQYAVFLNAAGVAGVSVGSYARHEISGYGEQDLFMVDNLGWTPKWNDAENKWKATGTQPMIHVTWFGAKAYADWVGGSLPTEAQWEYACRAGTATAYSFGNDAADLGDYCWYSDNSRSINGPSPVGTKLPNPWGLYDMHGNVVEWCSDWWGGTYDTADATDPTGPDTGFNRVFRGGFWPGSAKNCRSASRNSIFPGFDSNFIGFRVVFNE